MRTLTLILATLVVVLAACGGGGSSSDQSPKERLAEAKHIFDDARYIGFTLSADDLPDDLKALQSATGTGTHAPSFTGEVRVQAGVTVKAPIISVDNKVYAKLPFSGWSELDPSDYGAPDPAALIAPKTGISSLFTKTQDPSADGSERQGKEVLTKIHGTLSGDAVHELFPSAATDEFDVTYTLTDDNTMSSVTITGPFYGDHGDITYTIDLDLSADPVTIKAPAL